MTNATGARPTNVLDYFREAQRTRPFAIAFNAFVTPLLVAIKLAVLGFRDFGLPRLSASALGICVYLAARTRRCASSGIGYT